MKKLLLVLMMTAVVGLGCKDDAAGDGAAEKSGGGGEAAAAEKAGGTEKAGAAAVDQSTPDAVLQVVFTAAKSGDLSRLGGLCDPDGEGDGDVKNICKLAEDPSGKDEFVAYFATGKIAGDAAIEGDAAQVSFHFGPDGKREETMNLVKRGDRWYLKSF